METKEIMLKQAINKALNSMTYCHLMINDPSEEHLCKASDELERIAKELLMYLEEDEDWME